MYLNCHRRRKTTNIHILFQRTRQTPWLSYVCWAPFCHSSSSSQPVIFCCQTERELWINWCEMSMKKALLCVTELRIEIKATQIISLMSGLSISTRLSVECWSQPTYKNNNNKLRVISSSLSNDMRRRGMEIIIKTSASSSHFVLLIEQSSSFQE